MHHPPALNASARQQAVFVGAAVIFVQFTANFLPFSFQQAHRDAVGCDALCYGYLQSATAALSFIGAIAVGRLSDRVGRVNMLYVGLFASILAHLLIISRNNVWVLFLAAIPSSMNQNHSVMKALISDWTSGGAGAGAGERTAHMGSVGLAAGLSFAAGPLLGAAAFSSVRAARAAAVAGLAMGGLLLKMLPETRCIGSGSDVPKGVNTAPELQRDRKAVARSWPNLAALFSAHTTGAQLLLLVRMCMGLAYSIFNGMFMISLKTRFGFSPLQHGLLMAWIGASHAIAQGVLAKRLVRAFDNRFALLLVCALVLGAGRALQTHVSSVPALYAVTLGLVTALGTMNTLLAAASVQAASAGAVGALFGGMEAAEKLTALCGPALGGILFKTHHLLPTITNLFLYMTIFIIIFFWFQKHVLNFPAVKEKTDSSPPQSPGLSVPVLAVSGAPRRKTPLGQRNRRAKLKTK
jgi:DHA1 family tetracycline resistance protein-like MFS transporter